MPAINTCLLNIESRRRYGGTPDLRFRLLSLSAMTMIRRRLAELPWRTCDFTIGGLYLWADYFRYRYALVGETLVVNGVSERDVTLPAFSLPLGGDMATTVDKLRRFCAGRCQPLRFSAVPEAALPLLENLGGRVDAELPQWADYLYCATDLATLAGKRYNKKRNHVNRFRLDHPDAEVVELRDEVVGQALAFLAGQPMELDATPMALYEREQVAKVLRHYSDFPFEGIALKTPERGIVAFTFGEVVGDTLHSHVEKIDHSVAGAGEAINTLFARHMLERHPEIAYINRQDDAGDPGLRQAKESWQPIGLLRKFDVVF